MVYRYDIHSDFYVSLAKLFEKEYHCAGLGIRCPHFLYNDCQNGYEELRTCEQPIADYVEGNFNLIP
jgi:hypothetical protein